MEVEGTVELDLEGLNIVRHLKIDRGKKKVSVSRSHLDKRCVYLI